MGYVQSCRDSIQRMIAEIEGRPAPLPKKGNVMAFLTMPFDASKDDLDRCARGACLTENCYELDETVGGPGGHRMLVCGHCDTDEDGRKRNANGDFLPRNV